MLSRLFLLGLLSLTSLGVAQPSPQNERLATVRTFLDLDAAASELVKQPYQAPKEDLESFFSKLNYDGHRSIRFQSEEALFHEKKNTYRVEFFHPGWMFKKPVYFYNLTEGQSTPLIFNTKFFDYSALKLPSPVTYPEGYSGFRLLANDTFLDRRFEFLVYQGASYFRAVTTKLGWGLSARGLAINTIGGEPEEFPDFTHFWLQEPQDGDKSFRYYALLQGPSVVGAYEFEVQPGEETIMDIQVSLYLRKPVKLLGLAPFSSMFWFGENTQPKPIDFRPEVHDSDGLLIQPKDGPVLWRPLDNGKSMRQSVFALNDLEGFGLQKRDRDYKNFEDLEARYEKRTAVWVEPKSGFGKGKLHLIELATGEETWDNIVTLWEPSSQPEPGQALRYAYRLSWLEEKRHDFAKVTATRWGEAVATPEIPNDYVFVLDFTKGKLADQKPADWLPKIAVNLGKNSAKILDQRVMLNPETGGYRAFFKLDIPEDTKLMEMTCDLLDDEKHSISERWTYQWTR